MPSEYEYEPFEAFIARRDEILKIVYVSCYALKHLEGAGKLSAVLKQPKDAQDHTGLMEKEALKEAADGFPLMHSTGTLLLWAALESSTRDMLIRWLVKHPKALQAKDVANVRIKIGEYEQLDTENRMRFVVGLVEKETGSALQPGVGRFTGLLRVFSINPQCDDELKRDLLEMASLRHCIAHRAGVADRKLLTACPWLTLKENDRIAIKREDFLRYSKAVSNYAANTIEAARAASSALSAASAPSAS